MADILEKMAAFGITLKNLDMVKGCARKASAPATKQTAAKFRDPNGETWSGRGSMPRWLSEQVTQGRTKEEFAIKRFKESFSVSLECSMPLKMAQRITV